MRSRRKAQGEKAVDEFRQRQPRQVFEQRIARSAAGKPAFGAADRHGSEDEPGKRDARANGERHREARAARESCRGAAGAVEMAEIVLLARHGNRMGRIAALIKPADLPYIR
ncbi:hypothetical protein ABID26_002065 [Mesorhizobium shonense]|uniref:Uncharacterized protein n=1 Tax=Mesorhizobium shonense TaxID=1209948 RepID=A0ABV2HPZ9_9HYPH